MNYKKLKNHLSIQNYKRIILKFNIFQMKLKDYNKLYRTKINRFKISINLIKNIKFQKNNTIITTTNYKI